MLIIRTSIAIALLCASQAAAYGAESNTPGVYAGVLFGTTKAPSYLVGNSITTGAALGYRFDDTLAVEAYTRSLSFIFERGQAPQRNDGLALVLSKPVAEHVELYGRLSAGRTVFVTSSKNNDHAVTDLGGAIGVRYGFGPSFGVKLEAGYLQKTEVRSLSLGFDYRF